MIIEAPTRPLTPPTGPAPQRPGAPLLQMSGLRKTYRQGQSAVQALRGVSLDVAPGELLAICGPSGSGKTTLLNMVGLIDRPDAGHVHLRGQDVGSLSRNQLAELRNLHIGFIFQNFNLMPVLSAYENVLLPLQIRGGVGRVGRERARALLAEVGLAEHLHARPDRMSGGQRQRVAIARALITDPQIVIADEPTANLDTETSQRVMALIGQLNRSRGVTFVFSTHDPRVTRHMHRCVWLADGQVTATPGASAC